MIFLLFCALSVVDFISIQAAAKAIPGGGAAAALAHGYLTALGLLQRFCSLNFGALFWFLASSGAFQPCRDFPARFRAKVLNSPSPFFFFSFSSLYFDFPLEVSFPRDFCPDFFCCCWFFNYYFEIFCWILAPEQPSLGPPGATTSEELSAFIPSVYGSFPSLFLIFILFFCCSAPLGNFPEVLFPPSTPSPQNPQKQRHKTPRGKGNKSIFQVEQVELQLCSRLPSLHPSSIIIDHHPSFFPSLFFFLPSFFPSLPGHGGARTHSLPRAQLCTYSV